MNALYSSFFILLLLLLSNECKSSKKFSKNLNLSPYNQERKITNDSNIFLFPKVIDAKFDNNSTVSQTENEQVHRNKHENRVRRTPKYVRGIMRQNLKFSRLEQDESVQYKKPKKRSSMNVSKTFVEETPRMEKKAEHSIFQKKREVDQYEDFNNNQQLEDEANNSDDESNHEKHQKIKIKHHHHHHHHNHIKEIVKKVPEPYPVEKIVHIPVEKIVEKIVHVPKYVEKIVNVPYEKIVHVPKPYAVEKIVEKKIPYPVEKIVHVPVEKVVEKIIHVPKPYPVEKVVEKIVHIPVEKVVEKIVHIPKPYPVEKIVNKLIHIPRPYPVIKPVPYPVEVKVPMPYEGHMSFHPEKNNPTSNEILKNSQPYHFENVKKIEHKEKEVFEEQQEQNENDDNENNNPENSSDILKTGFGVTSHYPFQTINFGASAPEGPFNFHQNYNAFGFFRNVDKNNDEKKNEQSNINTENGDMQQQGSANSYHVLAITNSLPLSLPIFQIPPRPFQHHFDYAIDSMKKNNSNII